MTRFEHEGQKYVKIGNRAVPFDDVGANGKPIIKVTTKRTVHPDGRKDVTVSVPTFEIKSNNK